MPFLNISRVTTGHEEITIHYNFGVIHQSPRVRHIEWSKNDQPLDYDSKKYLGGGILDSRFTIMSPTYEDRGNYSCKVTNAVGTVTKNIMLGNVHFQLLLRVRVSKNLPSRQYSRSWTRLDEPKLLNFGFEVNFYNNIPVYNKWIYIFFLPNINTFKLF